MRSGYVQVIHVADESFVTRAAGVDKFGARAPGQRLQTSPQSSRRVLRKESMALLEAA